MVQLRFAGNRRRHVDGRLSPASFGMDYTLPPAIKIGAVSVSAMKEAAADVVRGEAGARARLKSLVERARWLHAKGALIGRGFFGSGYMLVCLVRDFARSGDCWLMRAALDAGADVNAEDGFGQTPLAIAARKGNTGLVALLLEKGADLNRATNGGLTPLMLAASQGRGPCVEMLLDAGASTSSQSKAGLTAGDMARTEEIRRNIRYASQGQWPGSCRGGAQPRATDMLGSTEVSSVSPAS